MEPSKDLFIEYKSALAGLCYYAATLADIKERVSDGEILDAQKFEFFCERLAVCKRHFLQAKEKLGYTDGLAFLNNANFAGFSIRNGVLLGNREHIYKILMPWYNGFPEQGNNFQYEVATYLLAFESIEDEKKPTIETMEDLVGQEKEDIVPMKLPWWRRIFQKAS